MKLHAKGLIVAVTLTALTAVAIAGATGAAASTTDFEKSMVAWHNDTRVQYGLPPLRVSAELSSLARRYSQRMAEAGDVWHMPSLGSDMRRWNELGDNVGMSNDLNRLEGGFMDSPTHRDNILYSKYKLVGVGIIDDEGEFFVTVIFMTPLPALKGPAAVSQQRLTTAMKGSQGPETAVDILLQLTGMDAGLSG
ncbi:MAG: CAP domain-containing protein [Actinomycetota bacterium]|nr:CAP domain-containing protein [Actinomycetota bacterium]